MTTPRTLHTTPAPAQTLSAADELTVVAWHDPVVEHAPGAIPTASDDALIWYVPSVGTIGMVMAHRFARHASDGPSRWTIEDVARTLGMGTSASRVVHVLDRLERFGITRRHAGVVAVRLWLAPLTYRQRSQLPRYLAAVYDAR